MAVFEKNAYYFDRGVDDLQCFRMSFRVSTLTWLELRLKSRMVYLSEGGQMKSQTPLMKEVLDLMKCTCLETHEYMTNNR